MATKRTKKEPYSKTIYTVEYTIFRSGNHVTKSISVASWSGVVDAIKIAVKYSTEVTDLNISRVLKTDTRVVAYFDET